MQSVFFHTHFPHTFRDVENKLKTQIRIVILTIQCRFTTDQFSPTAPANVYAPAAGTVQKVAHFL